MSNNTRVQILGDENRTYLWYSEMTPDELVNWWQSIDKTPCVEEDVLVLLPQDHFHVAEYSTDPMWTIFIHPQGANLAGPDEFVYVTAEGWLEDDEEVANE
jgi:hypothetical protein